MKYPGFIGIPYAGLSVAPMGDRCVNLYPEFDSQRQEWKLIGTPGLSLWAYCGGSDGDGIPIRGMFPVNNRVFVVAGNGLWEIYSDPTIPPVQRGAVTWFSNDPVSMDSNGTQLMICSGGLAYIFDLGTNTLTELGEQFSHCGFLDGYFLGLEPNSRKLFVSALNDGLTWSALDYGVKEGDPGNIVSFLVDHREVAVFGNKKSEVWYDSGAPDFPLWRRPDGSIEQGIAARWSAVRLDNSFFWLGGDERGAGVVWRASGYTPSRVSNHSVERQWQQYARMDDAIGFAYQEAGHSFYVLSFPTANRAWAFDCSTGAWHERLYWDSTHSAWQRHRAQCHCYAWGKHLVGDWENSAIFIQSLDYYDDANHAKRWLRAAPYISDENREIYYGTFEVLMEMGVGLNAGQGSTPTIMERHSNDGGYNWSNERQMGIGKQGERLYRAYLNQNGRGRKRCFEVSGTDPVKTVLTDALLQATVGYS